MGIEIKFSEMLFNEARARATQSKQFPARGQGIIIKDSTQMDIEATTGYRKFQNLHPSSRKIVFYAENNTDWDHFDPLIQELITNKGLEVCYVASDYNDPALQISSTSMKAFFIGYGSTRLSFFQNLDAQVAIMTMPDLALFNLERSRFGTHYIFVFNTAISTHMGFMRRAFDHYDAIFCTGPHQIAELHAAERIYNTPKKVLVEYGSPLIDQIIDQIDTAEVENNRLDDSLHVLIAPTYGPQNLIEVDDGQLCTGLVEHLLADGLRVSLRPHWMTSLNKPELIASLKSRFENSSLFSMDQGDSSILSLRKFDVLISDLSGIAIEFSLGFLKNVIYVDLPFRIRNNEYQDIGIEPIELQLRAKTGVVLSPDKLDSTAKVIRSIVSNQAKTRELCELARRETFFNLGESARFGADYIARQAKLDTLPVTNVDRQSNAETLVEIENVRCTYDNGVVGLEPTTLKFRRGEFTVLLGPSGAGKSTLLRILNGLVQSDTGRIWTFDVGEMRTKKHWRTHQARTAMIFQQHQLIEHHSALKNVLIGRVPHIRGWRNVFPWNEKQKRIALDCLDRVGLLEKSRERVSNLSGGQLQRVGIARALAQEPVLVLADEPVSSLDPETAERIIGFLKMICIDNNITAILSLHQVELARKFADRIVGISTGRISFDEHPEDVTMERLRILYGTGVLEAKN